MKTEQTKQLTTEQRLRVLEIVAPLCDKQIELFGMARLIEEFIFDITFRPKRYGQEYSMEYYIDKVVNPDPEKLIKSKKADSISIINS